MVHTVSKLKYFKYFHYYFIIISLSTSLFDKQRSCLLVGMHDGKLETQSYGLLRQRAHKGSMRKRTKLYRIAYEVTRHPTHTHTERQTLNSHRHTHTHTHQDSQCKYVSCTVRRSLCFVIQKHFPQKHKR